MDLDRQFYQTKQGRYFIKNSEKVNQLKLITYYNKLTPEKQVKYN